ncbi:MAG: hypothetical protein AB1633_06695 [Elusimicrobiota bacterium]
MYPHKETKSIDKAFFHFQVKQIALFLLPFLFLILCMITCDKGANNTKPPGGECIYKSDTGFAKIVSIKEISFIDTAKQDTYYNWAIRFKFSLDSSSIDSSFYRNQVMTYNGYPLPIDSAYIINNNVEVGNIYGCRKDSIIGGTGYGSCSPIGFRITDLP